MSLTAESREECWDDYSNSALIYIIVIPMILALEVNLLFLVSIMKVVVTKLRVQSNLSTQQLQVSCKNKSSCKNETSQSIFSLFCSMLVSF